MLKSVWIYDSLINVIVCSLCVYENDIYCLIPCNIEWCTMILNEIKFKRNHIMYNESYFYGTYPIYSNKLHVLLTGISY